ncbi:hypothetical protein GQX73_g7291 [Xylaria multiplex]|uniref:Ubiquitin-like protease family profile domain-containing protein n=1 Tax=Xylaria multiplex TaxID=323545 RepID=A0A7C8IXT4_9PEZI|nr:hypothetical protein GQX73_g7291 [Xylaria multiplex]
MASLAQPQSPILHSWTAPGHYLNCSICRNYRRQKSQEAEAEARRVGRSCAIGAGQPYNSRVLAVSPRLQTPNLRNILRRQGLNAATRRVTIQVPSLLYPVRPNETVGLRTGLLREGLTRKRPFTCSNNPEPAQYLVPDNLHHFPDVSNNVPYDTPRSVPHNVSYYVPGQFPEDIDDQAVPDFWALNTELIRQAALERATTSSTPVTENYFSMPGTWPSWADDPNGIPPPVPLPAVPLLHVERENPVNLPGPARNGFFTYFGELSARFLGVFQAAIWRPVQVVQPPQQDTNVTTTTNAVTTATQAAESGDFRVPKRPRSNTGPAQAGIQQFGPSRRRLSGKSTSLGLGRRTGSVYNRHMTSNSLAPNRVRNRSQNDPNFNYAGHFSLDAIYASDSEDEDANNEDVYPGSPMDIDTPEPIVSHETDAIPAQQSIYATHSQSKLKSDEQKPIALNTTEAISAQRSIHPIKADSKAKLSSATAAARRAVNLFPKNSAAPKAPLTPPFIKGDASIGTLPPSPPVVEKLRHKSTAASTSADVPSPRKSEKALYENALDFFTHDISHSLPGLEDERLPPDALKVEHLKRQLRERLRQEEIESQNAALASLGVRRPKSALIREPSPEWVNRALDAPSNGMFNPQTVHPDAVELKPRDFAKLVPSTAWLNDDCIQSTLCCLATYINKKANVKPKVDAPKCVPITSLYWKTFCQDHNKLYPRPFGRKWNMTPGNFLDIDTVLIPVNSNSHWTLIVIRPSRRTVSYLDSFHQPNETQIRHAYQWLELFLGDKFVADDWSTQEFGAPRQTNAWDCGMFVITNAMCLGLGLSPMCYNEDKMPIQRRRIAAMLLNGGFHGEFDLSDL